MKSCMTSGRIRRMIKKCPHLGVSENSVPHCTQWFCWSLSLLNGYFIGNIPNFQTYPHLEAHLEAENVAAEWGIDKWNQRVGVHDGGPRLLRKVKYLHCNHYNNEWLININHQSYTTLGFCKRNSKPIKELYKLYSSVKHCVFTDPGRALGRKGSTRRDAPRRPGRPSARARFNRTCEEDTSSTF